MLAGTDVPTVSHSHSHRCGRTPLHFASEAGSLECIKQLLTTGADARIQDYDGRSALHFATIDGEMECVKTLIGAGADPLVQDSQVVWGCACMRN